MRFFAALVFVAMMMVLAVSAAPKNVPTWDPETVAEFNSQQQQQQGSKRSLQEAVHQWLNPDKAKRDFASAFHNWLHPEDPVPSKLKQRSHVAGTAGESAFGFVRDWKTTAEKKFGLVPKN